MSVKTADVLQHTTEDSKNKMMIHLQNIHKVYRTDTVETLAINDISMDVEKGEFLSIMGPSGCGKSTFLNIIGLLDKPTKGHIRIDGQSTENLSANSIPLKFPVKDLSEA